MMKFSPTTFFGWLRAALAVAICAKPVYDYWTITNYSAVAEAAGAAAMTALVNGVLAGVAGHFTADTSTTPQ